MAAAEGEAECAAQEETPLGHGEEERLLGQEERMLGQEGDLHTEDEPDTMFHGGAEGCPVMRPDEKDFDDATHCTKRICSEKSTQALLFSEKVSNNAVNEILEHRQAQDDSPLSGSYGDVHLRTDPVTYHKMAVKRIKKRETFRREEVLIPLKMRHLCEEPSVRDSFVEILGIMKSSALYVLESAVDIDLSKLIETKWWQDMTYDGQFHMVWRIANQLLHALKFMHENGFGHFDVKPANVGFIFDTKRAVLLDFGTARKAVDGAPCDNTDGMTLFYRPPELFKGVQNKKVDVYATGCVLYFLLERRHMWQVQDVMRPGLNVFDFFKDLTPDDMHRKIPMNLPTDSRDLLIKMCHPHVSCRLSAEEACKHQFFSRPPVTPTPISLADRSTPNNSEPESTDSIHTPDVGGQDSEETLLVKLDMNPQKIPDVDGQETDEMPLMPLVGEKPGEHPQADTGLLRIPDVDEEEDETPLMQLDGGTPEEEEEEEALTDIGPQTVPAVVEEAVEDAQLTQLAGGNTEADKDQEMPSNIKTSGFVSMETMDSNQDRGDTVSSNITSE